MFTKADFVHYFTPYAFFPAHYPVNSPGRIAGFSRIPAMSYYVTKKPVFGKEEATILS